MATSNRISVDFVNGIGRLDQLFTLACRIRDGQPDPSKIIKQLLAEPYPSHVTISDPETGKRYQFAIKHGGYLICSIGEDKTSICHKEGCTRRPKVMKPFCGEHPIGGACHPEMMLWSSTEEDQIERRSFNVYRQQPTTDSVEDSQSSEEIPLSPCENSEPEQDLSSDDDKLIDYTSQQSDEDTEEIEPDEQDRDEVMMTARKIDVEETGPSDDMCERVSKRRKGEDGRPVETDDETAVDSPMVMGEDVKQLVVSVQSDIVNLNLLE